MLLGYAVIWSSGIDLSCRIFKISADCLLQWSLVRLIHWLWDQCGDEQKKLQGLTISINFVPCLFLCLRLLLLLPWQLVQYKLSLKLRQVRKLNSSWNISSWLVSAHYIAVVTGDTCSSVWVVAWYVVPRLLLRDAACVKKSTFTAGNIDVPWSLRFFQHTVTHP